MKKRLFRFILLLIFVGSIIGYIRLQQPFKEVTLEDYTSLGDYSFEYTANTDGETIYLYTNTTNFDLEFDDYGEIHITQGRNDTHIYITPLLAGVNPIKFKDYTTFYYPSFKGYTVVGSIEFDNGRYDFSPFLEGGDYIYSPNLPVETNTFQKEYSMIPFMSGLISLALLTISLLNRDDDYDHDIYQQGYQKPQRGRKERY